MSVNDIDAIDNLIETIKQKFKDPEFVKDFKKCVEEELEKPYMKQLNCYNYDCEFNEPKSPDIGTICWCSKYVDIDENANICDKRIIMALE